ncbi:hypothetical protein [Streptomyces sp. NPDC018045]|uniref:hypothetical protein n=1 Tax=Streptomyces sp. NPDC018045 TaxID=3365037 RepID=UPI0037AE8DB0
MDELDDLLAEFKVGDYVRAKGVDTRGHAVTRVGTLLAEPKKVTAQRNGTPAKGRRLFVGLAGTDPAERSTWTTIFPDSGSVERTEEPKSGQWSNTELREFPGIRTSNHGHRMYFGGKGGKRSVEPAEPVVLASVSYVGDGRYEIRDADNGEVLLTCTLQSRIWWAPASPVPPEPQVPAPVSHPAATVKEDLGKPVHHVRTGELVGYLTHKQFTPIDKVEQ